MPSPVKRVYFDNYMFLVDENVYAPAEDSFLFAENLELEEETSVLDMGTGCGILGILAAEKAREVVAVDLNPYAVRCAKENAKLNNVQNKIYYVQGDLFASLNERFKFDTVLFNAPYLPAEESEAISWLGRAWAGGATGRQVIDRFIVGVPNHLKQTGRVLLMQSTLADVDETLRRFADCGVSARAVVEQTLPFFETIKLVEATI
jgi:release factor glutamine methyltransferase